MRKAHKVRSGLPKQKFWRYVFAQDFDVLLRTNTAKHFGDTGVPFMNTPAAMKMLHKAATLLWAKLKNNHVDRDTTFAGVRMDVFTCTSYTHIVVHHRTHIVFTTSIYKIQGTHNSRRERHVSC